MVLHQAPTPNARHSVRSLVLAFAYAAGVVSGTALLIAAFSGNYDGSVVVDNGNRVTMAEMVMQQAAERALVSPRTEVLAGNVLNEKRGL